MSRTEDINPATVGVAVATIRRLAGGGRVSRSQAAELLVGWSYHTRLSAAEIVDVLSWFPDLDRSTCRHCTRTISRTIGPDGAASVWTHEHIETSTSTRHVTCGHHGEHGTSAEPIGGLRVRRRVTNVVASVAVACGVVLLGGIVALVVVLAGRYL